MTTLSSPGGNTRSGAFVSMGGTGSETCAIMVASSVLRSKGGCPVSIA